MFLLGLALIAIGAVLVLYVVLFTVCACAYVPPERRPAVTTDEVIGLTGLGMMVVGAFLSTVAMARSAWLAVRSRWAR
jgi:hypothetical protein